jgi:hypothetical protein
MEVQHDRCAGLDLARESLVACVRIQTGRKVTRHVETFGTTTRDLLRLSEWLRQYPPACTGRPLADPSGHRGGHRRQRGHHGPHRGLKLTRHPALQRHQDRRSGLAPIRPRTATTWPHNASVRRSRRDRARPEASPTCRRSLGAPLAQSPDADDQANDAREPEAAGAGASDCTRRATARGAPRGPRSAGVCMAR